MRFLAVLAVCVGVAVAANATDPKAAILIKFKNATDTCYDGKHGDPCKPEATFDFSTCITKQTFNGVIPLATHLDPKVIPAVTTDLAKLAASATQCETEHKTDKNATAYNICLSEGIKKVTEGETDKTQLALIDSLYSWNANVTACVTSGQKLGKNCTDAGVQNCTDTAADKLFEGILANPDIGLKF